MNHEFDKSTTLREMQDYLKQVGGKEITKIMFLKDKVRMEWE